MKKIFTSVLLLACCLLIFISFPKAANMQVGDPETRCDPEKFEIYAGICFPKVDLSKRTPAEILSDVLKFLMYIIGFLALLSFIISGIQYIISGGDIKKVEIAKNNLKWSITGLVIALCSLTILTLIAELISG